MDIEWLNSDNLKDIITDGFAEKCQDLSEEVKNGRVTLLTLVEKLGPLLTDTNLELRERGTYILAHVLKNLPKTFLEDKELYFIVQFFCDRLKDNVKVLSAALSGILTLVNMTNFPKDAPERVFHMMNQFVCCQTLKQEERNIVYRIFSVFIRSYAEEMKRLGPDFVLGFMQMMDGERDPRNLMLLFSIIPDFIQTFPLEHLTEEMFEVIACYYPIDFFGSAKDPDAITREDLATALQSCLIATPDFVHFCIPLVLEKLDSSLRIAKLDSLQLLENCCSTYTVEGLGQHLYSVWHAIYREAVPGTDKEICEASLRALNAIIHKFSVIPLNKEQQNLFNSILKDIVTTVRGSLYDVELSLFLPAVRFLLTATQASTSACQAIALEIVPLLMNLYHKGCSKEGKVTLLQTLTTFLASCESHKVTETAIPNMNQLWALYQDAARNSDPEIRQKGIHGLVISAHTFTAEVRHEVLEMLCTYVKNEESPAVQEEVLKCLKEISRQHPEEVMRTDLFLNLQMQGDCLSGDATALTVFSRCISALCEIAFLEPFRNTIVPQLLFIITDSFHEEKNRIGLKCLRKLVESTEASSEIHKYLYVHCSVISQLISWWHKGISSTNHSQLFSSEDLMLDIAKILSTIIRSQSESVQSEVIIEFLPYFFNTGPNSSHFQPLNPSSPWLQTQSVLLLEAILSPVRVTVSIPSLPELIESLVNLAIHTTHKLTSLSASRLIACEVNKMANDVMLQQILDTLYQMLMLVLQQQNDNAQVLKNAVQCYSYITKALLMRGHEEMIKWATFMMELLGRENVGLLMAEGFKLIMDQNEDYLTVDNHCTVKVLYRQRFFQFVQKLAVDYSSASKSVQVHFLMAFGYLMQGVPRVVLNMHLAELLPLIEECLDHKEVALLLSILETLRDLLEAKHPLLLDHLNTFLKKFLRLSHFQDSLKVRCMALQCVYNICNYPTMLLLPYKQEVLQELSLCLDDHKRIVRRQAVASRSRWFVLGAPGESERS